MPVQKKAFCTGMRIGIFMMLSEEGDQDAGHLTPGS